MGIFDSFFGRSKPPPANLDALFSIPQAAITLEVSGHQPLGIGAVCYRPNEGASFHELERDVLALLDADGGAATEKVDDSYGFTWLVNRNDDVSSLIADLHAINTGLEDAGFGSSLLCTLLIFADREGRRWGLVYLYKRGTFYPFVPRSDKKRDNSAELEIRALIGNDVAVESDLSKWLALWGAPGLDNN